MKNIHVLPTENSSRLSYNKDGVLQLNRLQWRKNTQNIYITSDEEIKEGDWVYLENYKNVLRFKLPSNKYFYKKIIMTTDQDLIADGVQSIDDEFLEWFVKNPSCESVKFENERVILDDVNYNFDVVEYKYKIIIPKEEQKQHLIDMMKSDEELGLYDKPNETLNEVALKFAKDHYEMYETSNFGSMHFGFIEGAKWQQEQNNLKTNKIMKQTAVEFLEEQIKDVKYNPLEINGYSNALEKLFEQAKEMEDENMINFLKSVFQQDGFDYKKALEQFKK